MDRSRLKLDVVALILLFGLVFIGLSLLSYDPADPPGPYTWPNNAQPENLCGHVGALVGYVLYSTLGFGSLFLVICLSILAILLFCHRTITDKILRAIGIACLLVAACTLCDKFQLTGMRGTVVGSGGYLGSFVSKLLGSHFSDAGSYLIITASLIVGAFLTIDYYLVRAIKAMFALRPRLRRPALFQGKAETTAAAPEMPQVRKTPFGTEPDIPLNTPSEAKEPALDLAEQLDRASDADDTVYQLPPLDLLADPDPFPYDRHEKGIREKGVILEKTLAEFGYTVRVVQIDTGPVITQYEIALEAGLRVGKIHSLADDLAIALKAPAVRIVAPIPGRDTVGIEVPNDERSTVRLKEVIRGSTQGTAKMHIPLFLGKDVKGNPLVYDLAQMPHLLIAGRTGTGKSVCLNALIQSILMTRRPNEVKMLMIDPKMVELSQYRRIPHLMHPVVTDMKKAEALLAWAVDKMEERYDILARAGVRHVSNYNALGEEEILRRLRPETEEEQARIPRHMPYIVIFADEMADLMMTAPKEVEGHIIRLAQKSRAVGIHLIIATQKPTVDVVTGLIKSNLPARIAFQVSSRSDSRVVLDESGAEKLLGHGDMLFLLPGTSHLMRAQGTFTSDAEIEAVVGFLESYEPEFTRELLQLNGDNSKKDQLKSLRERDELYAQAIEIVVNEGRGSVSLLQRALGIGYGRAARLIDYMAEDGLVGDYNGSQAREVLCTPEEWQAMNADPSAGQ